MKKVLFTLIVSLAVLVLLAGGLVAHAQLDLFTGTWTNIDPNTGGVTKLVINASGSNVTVHAWGACEPEDCDWGEVEGYAYGPSVSADLVSEAEAITALFDPGFSQTIMVIHPVGGDRLEAETLTRFTDSSGRSNYVNVYTFAREGGMPTLTSPPCGSTFSHFPRTTTLSWSTVPSAVSYTVEIDCFHCCKSNQWCTDIGQTWRIVPNVQTTNYTFDFVGAQPGRWRVWAIFAGGVEGQKTDWCEFTYTK
jgi:hypothetical protein